MAQVVARHTIYRRNGDHIEKIEAGTAFEPLSADEGEELTAADAVFHSQDDRVAYERAMEGATRNKVKPGISRTPIGAHVVAMERAAMSGDLPAHAAFDPVGGQAVRQAQETARQRREERNKGREADGTKRRSRQSDALA